MNPFEFVLTLAAMAIAAGLIGSVIRILSRYVERRAQPGGTADPDLLRGEVQALRAQLMEHEDLGRRVAELEERLDFAERMLVKRQGQARLPGDG